MIISEKACTAALNRAGVRQERRGLEIKREDIYPGAGTENEPACHIPNKKHPETRMFVSLSYLNTLCVLIDLSP